MTDREQLEQAIAAQEMLRGAVADEVIDVAVASLRKQLSALELAGQRRRQATILFADLQGFTTLAESLDAEVVTDLINDVWARLDEVITDHGGRIDKHIGDAVMAVWGAESSREDDPERAVRAALALQDTLAVGAHEMGRQLVLRVGVGAGPVLFGAVGKTNEFTAMGDTVNVASRLEHAGQPGEVLVSHDTYRHIRGVFDVRPKSSVRLRGRSDAVEVYTVRGSKPRALRIPTHGVEGVETRMIGHGPELDLLRATFDRVCSAGLEVVMVVGEPGVGKSRLLSEFESWLELLEVRVYYFSARALATAQTVPYGLIRDLLARRFGIVDHDDTSAVVTKLRSGFAPHLDDDQSDLVGYWLGFDVGSSSSQRLRGSSGLSSVGAAHLVHYFEAIGSRDPILLVMEDLHWADEESLDLVEEIVTRLPSTRLLTVAATRPGLFDTRPDFPRAAGSVSRLRLEPLSAEASRDLVAEVLKRVTNVPDDLVDLIVERTDGNPFFVEELIKMLVEDRVILADPARETWKLDLERLDPSAIPSTLTGVLEARLDSLRSIEREALQRASVIGRVFWDTAVSALKPAAAFDETSSALATVRDRELVYSSPHSSLGSGNEYVFKHALLRDVTYETVLLRDRRRMHALAAEWLSSNAGERIAEFLERIADQHRLAGNLTDAAALYQRAGKRALDAGKSATARRSLDLARNLLRQASLEPPGDLCLWLGEACVRIGFLDAADEALGEVLANPDDATQEAKALYLASWVASDRGDHSRERALLERAAAIDASTDADVRLRVLLGRAWYESGVGDYDEAQRLSEEALELAEATGDSPMIGAALAVIGMATQERGQTTEAMVYAERAVNVARESGDLEAEARALGNMGVMYHLRADAEGSRSDYEQAGRFYGQQVAMSQRLALAAPTAWATANVAQVSLRLGDEQSAAEHLRSAIETLLECGGEMLFCLIVGAELMFARGDIKRALELLGAVRSNPASTTGRQDEIKRVLGRFGLEADTVEAGMHAGEGLDEQHLARGLLLDLGHDLTHAETKSGPIIVRSP